MTAELLDGRRIAASVRADLEELASRYTAEHGRPAGLAIVHVGADPSAEVYMRSIVRSSEQVGVNASEIALPPDIPDAGLRAALLALNADETVQGILIETPLPPHLSTYTVAEAIDPHKDVDGISLRSAGNLFLRFPTFVPSTCAAVVEMLDRAEISIAGRRVVIVGASNVVGKPLAFVLVHRNATVTVCHIYTRDLAAQTRQAEILIVAVGRPGLITGDMVAPGAVVIDVGITVRPDGTLVGDVDFDSVSRVAGAISPVPGGVGQLTNLMLLRQTLLAGQLDAAAV